MTASARLIRQWEKQAGIVSRNQACRLLGIHQNTYRRLANGESEVSRTLRLAMAAVIADLAAFGDKAPLANRGLPDKLVD